MSSLRRLVPLLLVALIAVAPAPALAQGGAGDDQYQDPFGGQGGGGGGGSNDSGSDSGTDSGAQEEPPALTQEPPSGEVAAAEPVPAPAPADPAGTAVAPVEPGARAELPRTGLDAPVLALLGLGLLAAGIGLRLRTVDGHRS